MNYNLIIYFCVVLVAVIMYIYILYRILRNPYSFPYYYIDLDVSGRRNVDIVNEIETYLINYGLDEFANHYNQTEEWKALTLQKACKSVLKSLRVKQFYKVVDDDGLFVFNLCRDQTRYTQRNYVKTSYVVTNVMGTYHCNYSYIVGRYKELRKIGFETTTSKYYASDQRKLMTQELRERIKLRDNYTCQICGKYMPDGVGLHIDHIIPVSKGGKTVESK